jgi:hypothetical protein
MRFSLTIILALAIIITAGCISEDQNTLVTPARTTTEQTSFPATVPVTVLTHDPVRYLEGSIGGCFSNPENTCEICLDSDANVSSRDNAVSASGVIFFKSLSPETSCHDDELHEVNGSVTLTVFDNRSEKVTEVTKTFDVEKNGKVPVYLTTEISEDNPINWTYRLTIENNNPEVQSITLLLTPLPQQECTIDSHQRYRTSKSEWRVFGYVGNTGTQSGNCRVNVQLMAFDGNFLDTRDQMVYVTGGGTAPFSITVSEPSDKPAAYYNIFVYNQDII